MLEYLRILGYFFKRSLFTSDPRPKVLLFIHFLICLKFFHPKEVRAEVKKLAEYIDSRVSIKGFKVYKYQGNYEEAVFDLFGYDRDATVIIICHGCYCEWCHKWKVLREWTVDDSECMVRLDDNVLLNKQLGDLIVKELVKLTISIFKGSDWHSFGRLSWDI